MARPYVTGKTIASACFYGNIRGSIEASLSHCITNFKKINMKNSLLARPYVTEKTIASACFYGNIRGSHEASLSQYSIL